MPRPVGAQELKRRFRSTAPLVLPSLLACDFAHLAREIESVETAGAKALHLDVMDGRFVPNISFGIPVVEAVRRATELPLDVHLMIDKPERYIEQFRDAGADALTIHFEATADPPAVLQRIRALGALAGLALNPSTHLSAIEPSLAHCDLVLVMSVMPGFGGQKFDERALDKLRALRDRDDVDPLREVDGGITEETIGPSGDAGAELFVAGTAIFHTKDYAAAIRRLDAAAATRASA